MIELDVKVHDPLVLAQFGLRFSVPSGQHKVQPTEQGQLIPDLLSDRLDVFRDGRRDYGFTIRAMQITQADQDSR